MVLTSTSAFISIDFIADIRLCSQWQNIFFSQFEKKNSQFNQYKHFWQNNHVICVISLIKYYSLLVNQASFVSLIQKLLIILNICKKHLFPNDAKKFPISDKKTQNFPIPGYGSYSQNGEKKPWNWSIIHNISKLKEYNI